MNLSVIYKFFQTLWSLYWWSLFNQQFGSSGTLSPGTFSFGSLVVEIFESSEGLVIDILDTTNGDQTQVIIPGNQ